MRFRKPSTNGEVVYAVGDIHGRLDLLDIMLRLIADAAGNEAGRARVIFLGDYIDRGPASSGVLGRLAGLKSDGARLCFLKGNHEASMLRFLDDASLGPQWCAFGGIETLASYGVAAPREAEDDAGWELARQELAARLPPAHLEFLQRLDLMTEVGDYVFVHAGVRPGQSLETQAEEDLLWIRDDFLNDRRRLPKIVVHGHTPQPAPVRDRRRIGLDTGAYMTGVLTAARIEAGDVTFMSARR